MYSQNNEEEIILNYFKDKKGIFLEIGAFDPFLFSNTRCLYEKGWNGIQVEPNPICMKNLKKEYGKSENITLLEVAITDKNGFITFYEPNGDAVGTTDVEHKIKWETGSTVTFNEIIVPTMSMEDLLSKYGNNVNFLNIDVEGTNIKLFDLIPIDYFSNIDMLCIEHDNQHEYLLEKMTNLGFKELLFNPENIILAK